MSSRLRMAAPGITAVCGFQGTGVKGLVCGGAGYIGSHMFRHLVAHGHEVVVFDKVSAGHHVAVGAAALVAGALLEPAVIEMLFAAHCFDVVMHFLALWLVGVSVSEP